MSSIQDYFAPTGIDDAVRLLAQGETTLLAGGTDLMPQTSRGAREFKPRLLNINRVRELKGIGLRDDEIRVPALTTVTEILSSELLQEQAPILTEVADRFAAGQIRNSATIGGNICNASPAGDMIIPLLLLDATVYMASWAEGALVTRTVPLCDFFTGPGETVLRSGEMLSCVRFVPPPDDFTARFEKAGARPALDISVVSVGVAGRLQNGALKDARVALGAVAPTPLRSKSTEASIEGRVLNDDVIAEAVRTARVKIAPIDDVRATAWYRKELVGVYLRRLLQDVSQA